MSSLRIAFAAAVCVAMAMFSDCELRGTATPQDTKPQSLTLIEYSDFQCPFAAAGQPIVERVLAAFGSSMTYEYRHHVISTHPMADEAARWYEALRDRDPLAATFFRQTLFGNQARLAKERVRFLAEIVRRSGQSPTLIARESRSAIISERLAAHAREVKDYKLGSTPGYVVAGAPVEGPTSFAQFETMVCDQWRRPAAATPPSTRADEFDCWALVYPDWSRLAALEKGQLVAPLKRFRTK